MNIFQKLYIRFVCYRGAKNFMKMLDELSSLFVEAGNVTALAEYAKIHQNIMDDFYKKDNSLQFCIETLDYLEPYVEGNFQGNKTMEIREGVMKLVYLLFLFALGELTEQQIAAILEDAVIEDDEEGGDI